MKQRFSSLDVNVIAHELSNSLCTLRLSNVYDLSSRIFLLKFQKPDKRESLIVDSGFRCHLTSFTRATAPAPSAFVSRLRKFLRSRRVTSVAQVGTDRILDFQFSDGQYHLFLEFYAGGNIVLTDGEYTIIALLRNVSEGEEHESLRLGLKYSVTNKQNYNSTPPVSIERLKSALEKTRAKVSKDASVTQKKSKKKREDLLQKALGSEFHEFPPVLLDHVLRARNIAVQTTPNEILDDESKIGCVLTALEDAKNLVNNLEAVELATGYIIAKYRNKPRSDQEDLNDAGLSQAPRREDLVYEDFQPFRPLNTGEAQTVTVLELKGFNKTVDEFFSSVESQKLESRVTEREDTAKKRLDAAKQDHEKRLGGLQQVQELNVRRAQAIESNLERVQEATAAVNSLIAQGMGWPEIARMIELEQRRQNPVAEMIKLPLKLYENTITLLLGEAAEDGVADFEGESTDSEISDDDDDDADNARPSNQLSGANDKRLAVDIDLALSPWSNAREYYDQKKTAAVKEVRTLQASAKALKSTEKKITADLKKGLKQEKELMRPQRTPMWFEKFFYFVSSEGYIVLAGKDLAQNDILYQRHLQKGDVFVHADLNGAPVAVVKNRPGMIDAPIPPSTLSQAGSLAVCTSSAWDSKAVMSAWWVPAKQVSKMASNGEYLQTGAFNVEGNKNFLPPGQLLLGFGVMFRISESSKARHQKHRVVDDQTTQSAIADDDANDVDVDEKHDERDEIRDDIGTGPINDTKDDTAQQKVPRRTEDEENGEASSEDSDSNPEDAPTNPLQTNGDFLESQDAIRDDDAQKPLDKEAQEEHSDQEAPDNSPAPDDDETQSISTTNDGKSGVRHLSTRERRLMRKGTHPSDGSGATIAEDASSSTATDQPAPPPPEQLQTQKPKPQPQPRGKQSKRQKQKSKYADQDEEDRALAMRLLGSAAAQEKAKEEVVTKATKEEEAAAARERRRKQHQMVAEKGKKAEELRRLKMEGSAGGVGGGSQADDEDGAATEEGEDQKIDFDCFVGEPLPGDEVLDAIAVCGPWDAVGRKCKWRVKVQPGAVKKGKAVREILASLNRDFAALEKKNSSSSSSATVGGRVAASGASDSTGPGPGSEEAGDGGGVGGVPDAGKKDGGDTSTSTQAMVSTSDADKLHAVQADLVRGIRETEVIGLVPVGKMRAVISGADSGDAGKKGGKGNNASGSRGGKGGGRGGKGSKKQR